MANKAAKDRFKERRAVRMSEGIPPKGIPDEGIPAGIPVSVEYPVTAGEYPIRYLTDSTGQQHQIDFAERRRIQKLVDGGSFKQLSDDYNLIKNYNLKYFLGYSDVDTVDDLRRPADNKVNLTTAELEHNQRILSKRDADVRAKISTTPLDKLITKGSFIPNWRLAQG